MVTTEPIEMQTTPIVIQEWVEVECGKCGAMLKIAKTEFAADIIDRLPYVEEVVTWLELGESPCAEDMMPCPVCRMGRGGVYPLGKIGNRPPLGWMVIVDPTGEYYVHSPDEGWFALPKGGGWTERSPLDRRMAWQLTRHHGEWHPLRSFWDAPETIAPLGLPAWGRELADWREDQRIARMTPEESAAEEAAELMAWETESAAQRATECWRGSEAGWALHPLGGGAPAPDGRPGAFVGYTPAGRGWEFENAPGGWERRRISTFNRVYLLDEIHPSVAAGTGFPPADWRGGPDAAKEPGPQ